MSVLTPLHIIDFIVRIQAIVRNNMIEKTQLNPSISYLQTELPSIRNIPSGINKSELLLNSAKHLFRFIPNDSDERWQIASHYRSLVETNKFKPVHLEIALRATYLSPILSFREACMSYTYEPNIRQLARAVVNLSQNQFLNSKFSSINHGLSNSLKIEFALTDSIQMGTNSRNITGCPESLYQLQLFDQEIYVGRIGFNLHLESDTKVVSITNIQGIPNGKDIYNEIDESIETKPFNLLIQKLKESLPKENNIIYRGLKNPRHITSAQLYNTTLKSEKITRMSFKKELISNYLSDQPVN